MPISLKMPALSPTMEEGTLAKWLVKEGDHVEPGDIVAEIETDKATMEYEVVDEGVIAQILVAEGTEGVKVGADIALIEGEGGDSAPGGDSSTKAKEKAEVGEAEKSAAPDEPDPEPADRGYGGRDEVETDADTTAKGASDQGSQSTPPPPNVDGERVKASPLARRLAAERGVDLTEVEGSGPHGRIVKADIDALSEGKATAKRDAPARGEVETVEMADNTRALLDARVPHDVERLSGMRKTIARRLAQSMQEAPHIYLSVDIRLDRLLAARKEMNEALADREIKLSVNDFLVKALARALTDVPECNVAFAGKELIRYKRADISVAVSIKNGLITPIVADAGGKSLSEISEEMRDLGERAKAGKLDPEEYQGGTASLSNMGMMGIKQFTAVINPPQATILAIGAGEERAIVEDGEIKVATMMTATGSFDHRAVDGADGARLMTAFKQYVENPLAMLA